MKELKNNGADTLDCIKGKVIESIDGLESGSDSVRFKFSDGTVLHMYHQQDCCEHVSVEDVSGDVNDLLYAPIVMAEESTNHDDPPPEDRSADSHTWTFYRFATTAGYVTVRCYGSSNGYYSESVDWTLYDENDKEN
jgi:hypothetical protein